MTKNRRNSPSDSSHTTTLTSESAKLLLETIKPSRKDILQLLCNSINRSLQERLKDAWEIRQNADKHYKARIAKLTEDTIHATKAGKAFKKLNQAAIALNGSVQCQLNSHAKTVSMTVTVIVPVPEDIDVKAFEMTPEERRDFDAPYSPTLSRYNGRGEPNIEPSEVVSYLARQDAKTMRAVDEAAQQIVAAITRQSEPLLITEVVE